MAVHSYATKTSASITLQHSASTTGNGRTLQTTVVGGNVFSSISSGRERRGSLAKQRKDKGKYIENSRTPLDSQGHSDEDTAKGTVNPTLGVHPMLFKLILTRTHYPLSNLTDGVLLPFSHSLRKLVRNVITLFNRCI